MKVLKLFCGDNQLLLLPGILDSACIPHGILEEYHGGNSLHIEENDYERARDVLNEVLGEGNWSS